MAAQDEFSTMQLVIRKYYKAHDHWGFNHMENTVEDDEDNAAQKNRQKKESKLHRQSS